MRNSNLRKTETIKNGFHQMVRKQCTSCQRKVVDFGGERLCSLMGLKVNPCFCCPKWEMNPSLDKAGQGLGKVKKKEYLVFVMAVRCEENEAIQSGILLEQQRRSVEQLRDEFTREHGSIWELR